MSTKSAGSTDELGNVWEDTVIVAFRDLQWRQWLDDIDAATQQNDLGKAAALKAVGPDHIHKLDDDAESLFGDILTNHDGRYFVFEFKGGRAGHRDEHEKTMFIKLSHYLVTAGEDDRQKLLDLSTACHFGVFGTRLVKGEGTRLTLQQVIGEATAPPIPNAPRMADLAIHAHEYMDWIHVNNRRLLSLSQGEVSKLTDVQQNYVGALRGLVVLSTSVRTAMEGITHRIESPTRRVLEDMVWPQAGVAPAGADAKGYVDYLKLLTSIGGGDPDTPITLVAVVGRRIVYWTTSAQRLKHTLIYWDHLFAQVAAKAAASSPSAQGGVAPAADSTGNTKTLKSSV